MAYSKQTWTDDVSAVTGARMTHIEQGIYDNSIATDKINPSGTATTTAEIEEGQITDVIGFKSLKLKGQTSQYTTTGINLCEAKLPTTTQSGVTLTNNGDGTYTLNGTNSSSGTITFRINQGNGVADNLQDYEDGAYTLDLGVAIPNVQMCLTQNSTYTNFLVTGYGVRLISGTLSSATNTFIYIAIKTGTTINNVTIKPMLVKGTYTTSTMPNFEPYTGGKASPNPDFPQDVNNVSGENVIGINNKNINSSTLEVGNISNGANTTDNNVVRSKDYIMVTPSTAYTFGINGTANKVVVSMYDENKTFLTNDGANGYASSNGKFTTYSNAKYIRYRSYSADKSLFESGNIQIEKGTSATSFVAHQGNEFEINLGTENLLKNIIQQTTTEGVTFYPQFDGSVVANGKATATSLIWVNNGITLKAGTYTLSGCPKGGSDSSYRLDINSGAYVDYGNGITFTLNSDTTLTNIRIRIANGYNAQGVVFKPMIERGSVRHNYNKYGEGLELCKIGTYQDYIYKKDGKWWKHNEVGRKTLNGSETWTRESTNTSGKGRFQINLGNLISNNIVKPSSNANVGLILSDLFITVVAGTNGTYGCHEGISLDTSGYVQIYDETQYASDVATFKTWLANHNTNLYWVYSTPIDEEITYAPLLRQLDELYNSGLYDVTNISQDNSSEAFILDMEACKNNINGIVEYIRR